MTSFKRAEFAATLIKSMLLATSLVGGAVLISMAYQSWEVGIGAASLVFFHAIARGH
jgi:hypothetical protein